MESDSSWIKKHVQETYESGVFFALDHSKRSTPTTFVGKQWKDQLMTCFTSGSVYNKTWVGIKLNAAVFQMFNVLSFCLLCCEICCLQKCFSTLIFLPSRYLLKPGESSYLIISDRPTARQEVVNSGQEVWPIRKMLPWNHPGNEE